MTIVPANVTEMIKVLEDKMIECALILETRYQTRMSRHQKQMPIPKIRLCRLGKKLGVANRVDNYIELNLDLCDQEHWHIILNDTLPHEYCHLVAPLIYDQWKHGYDKNSGWSHGRAWKECMGVLGVAPNVTHEIDNEVRKKLVLRHVKREFVYGCNCGKTFELTAILHNRIQSGSHRVCGQCRTRIVFKRYKA